MWDEIRGYIVAFVVVPLVLGGLWYLGYRAVTGHWPDVQRCETAIEWDGKSNPSVCD
jgi:hypothetical protein